MAVVNIISSWGWVCLSVLKNMAASIYKWTNDDTAMLIDWRARNAGIFSGRRLTAIRGYEVFVKERGLEGLVSPAFIKKKWENLKQKYVTLKRVSMESGTDSAAESWRWYSQMEDALGGRIPEIKPSCNIKMPAVFISTDHDDMVHSLELTVDPQSPPPLPLPPPPPIKRQRTNSTDVMLEFLGKQEDRDQQRDIEWIQREELREREALEREEQRESEAVEREERREREAIAREARREREAVEREGRRERDAMEREACRDREAREREERREKEFRDREERRETEFRERHERMERLYMEREERLLSILEKLLNK